MVRFERARLMRAGRSALADRVEHLSVTVGDGAGFDVRSLEKNGRDRLIEVKTMAYGKDTPFLISRNELAVSRDRAGDFQAWQVRRGAPEVHGA